MDEKPPPTPTLLLILFLFLPKGSPCPLHSQSARWTCLSFFLFFKVVLADKERILSFVAHPEYLLCFSLCQTLSTEQKDETKKLYVLFVRIQSFTISPI